MSILGSTLQLKVDARYYFDLYEDFTVTGEIGREFADLHAAKRRRTSSSQPRPRTSSRWRSPKADQVDVREEAGNVVLIVGISFTARYVV